MWRKEQGRLVSEDGETLAQMLQRKAWRVFAGLMTEPINDNLRLGAAASRKGADYYRTVGQALLKLKEEVVPFGQWESWVAANYTCSIRQAERYMKLAKSDVTADLETLWRILNSNRRKPKPKPDPDDNPPQPPEDVKLYFSEEEKAELDRKVNRLAERWGTKNASDTVLAAIRRCYVLEFPGEEA